MRGTKPLSSVGPIAPESDWRVLQTGSHLFVSTAARIKLKSFEDTGR